MSLHFILFFFNFYFIFIFSHLLIYLFFIYLFIYFCCCYCNSVHTSLRKSFLEWILLSACTRQCWRMMAPWRPCGCRGSAEPRSRQMVRGGQTDCAGRREPGGRWNQSRKHPKHKTFHLRIPYYTEEYCLNKYCTFLYRGLTVALLPLRLPAAPSGSR